MRRLLFSISGLLLFCGLYAQSGLVNTFASPSAKLSPVGMSDVKWTNGFWAERFAICRDVMVPRLWQTYTSRDSCFAFENFRIAAGLDTGRFRGPSFHDGDFYKTLEALAATYCITRDRKIDQWMDSAIAVISKAQQADGYIYTRNIIRQNGHGPQKVFDDHLSFEAYNFGHLMTAACVHYRATGKKSLLNIAQQAAGFLITFYAGATPEQARNAICPSHYMGLAELYRTTSDRRYLELLNHLMDIRGTVEGTDDNSDRQPFRDMQKVVGHAVRANYLFAGAADLYAESGDTVLLQTLYRMWDNVVNHKMYVTGGCGALYDGVSVDGTSYKPDTVQKIHQAYGKDYQLPNFSAHNETCANIGNVLWNWRMFLITGESKYMDIVELALYNSVLSGVSLDGTSYFYTNPLAASSDYPYHLRWEGGRIPYIEKSNCCPPNIVRTIAEVNDYMYSTGNEGVFVNLYSGNSLKTTLKDGSPLQIDQYTNYPWEGKVTLIIGQAPTHPFSIHLRIPGWCSKAIVRINGRPADAAIMDGYARYSRLWEKGDKLELEMSMPPVLLESNPLVEETKNQVAVRRGPLIYCLESADIRKTNVFDILIPSNIVLEPVTEKLGNATVLSLEGRALAKENGKWKGQLYRPVNNNLNPVNIRLIPYFAWANRGRSDMTVWLPLVR